MNVSAFIRSYRGDAQWLYYCLRSLQKHGQQLSEVVVALPESDRDMARELSDLGARFVFWQPVTVNGYIDQQICKMHADQFCKGDFILHLDSDCMLDSELWVDHFFMEDQSREFHPRPKLLIRRWEDAGDAQCWRPFTRTTLGVEPSFETMCSLPIIYHRSSHELFRNYVKQIHGRSFIEYVARLKDFSEFNAIGNFCHLFTPDAYHFIRATGPGDGYPRTLRQFWSRGAMKQQEMEDLLK